MKIEEKIEYIEEKYLGTYELPDVAGMDENERYAEMLRLSEHLKQRMQNEMLYNLEDYFAAQFWVEDVNDWKLNRKSVLNNKKELATLSNDQWSKVEFLRETADFICRLNTFRPYYPGICCSKGWSRIVGLAKLVKEMESVHHCPLTAQKALKMLRIQATGYLKHIGYAPAQDYVSNVYCSKSVDEMFEAIEMVDLHIKNGYKIGMVDEEIIMHDCLIGFMDDIYKENYIQAGRNILKMVQTVKPQIIIDKESEDDIINLAMKICDKYEVQLDKNGYDILYLCDEVIKCLNCRIMNNKQF